MASPTQNLTLIGLCDGELDPKRYRSSFFTNKVGGRPDWPPLISRQSPRCGLCGAALAHVAQVYCPLDASPYHRNLHLFACPAAECSGRSEGWRVFRSQCLETEAAARTPSRLAAVHQDAPLSSTDWCDTADDWGTEEDGWGGGGVKDKQPTAPEVQDHPGPDPSPGFSQMDVSSQLQDLSLEPHENVPVFHPFFVSVVDESDLSTEDVELQHAEQLLREYEGREGVVVGELDGGGGGGGGEKYEKTGARHGDAVFSRFMKRISLCPQQIMRYCRAGKPLFISEPPSDMAQAVSVCGSCGGARTFELQLMPALVSLLQRKDTGAVETELEFGTVLVYTCTSSCWTQGSGSALDEFCFVQADPDQQLFK